MNGVHEEANDRQVRLETLVREQAAQWDPDARVTALVRPDGKVDITVVSRLFEGKDSRDREAAFWPVFDPVPKSELIYLTYCLLLTPAEEAAGSFRAAPAAPSEPENWDD